MATNDNIISKNFVNKELKLDSAEQATVFEYTMNQVNKMINQKQPTYSPWIRITLGDDDATSVTFNTASTSLKQNLIVSLSIDKTSAGTCNQFTLNVYYDPFNMGQEAANAVNGLDDIIAKALEFDLSDTSGANNLTATIQYGYNNTGDEDIVSPKYKLFLTNATCDTEFASGLTTYTFEGCSMLGPECDLSVEFPAFEDKKLVQTVANILYQYYGDPSDTSVKVDSGITPREASPKYKINIPDSLYNTSPTISRNATTTASPFNYCTTLLKGQMTTDDQNSNEYSDTSKLKYNQIPRYSLSISDSNKSIDLSYISPKDTRDNSQNISISTPFTWSTQQPSIVAKWKPEVDLRLYLIQKAKLLNAKTLIDNLSNGSETLTEEGVSSATKSLSTLSSSFGIPDTWSDKISAASSSEEKAKIISDAVYEIQLKYLNSTVAEMYNAELTLVGIPADIPNCCELTIIPRVLESVSRTSGIYYVIGATDNINSDGTFVTILKLMRCRAIDEKYEFDTSAAAKAAESSTDNNKNNTDHSSGELTIEDEGRELPGKLYPSEGGIALG